MNPKQVAAEAALNHIESGMIVGLGTGSTADFFLTALGNAIRTGRFKDIRGVPTSKKSEARSIELGIPLATLAQCPLSDVAVDGADEIAPGLQLTKGLGGALLREKVVAQNSKRFVVIADEGKVVKFLGEHTPLPVEVTQFGFETQEAFLRTLGAEPKLRAGVDGKPFVTDNGNFIYDCHFKNGNHSPAAVEAALNNRAGIVESGLFLGIAKVALIGSETGVREMRP
jgi:ribose 5-phosphate isomerase A